MTNIKAHARTPASFKTSAPAAAPASAKAPKTATPAKVAAPQLQSATTARTAASAHVELLEKLTRSNKPDAEVGAAVKKSGEGLSYEASNLLWSKDGQDLRGRMLDASKVLSEQRPNMVVAGVSMAESYASGKLTSAIADHDAAATTRLAKDFVAKFPSSSLAVWASGLAAK